jgi:hypothetical protein
MPDKDSTPENYECGDCTACCRELIIDVPGLTKLAGVLCSNCVDGKGCAIYGVRPQACRDFLCGWRLLPLPEEWRPDHSQILITQEPADPDAGIVGGYKFFFFGSLEKIFWRPFLLFVSSLIAADKTVYIAVPGAAGHCSRMMVITPEPELKEAVANWNYAAIVGIVAGLIQSCLDTPGDPVVFKNLQLQ